MTFLQTLGLAAITLSISACGGQAFDQASGRCELNGKTLDDGESAKDDCNTCSCENGELNCTLISCADDKSCTYDGETYRDGESFSDGCNSCSCDDGEVFCTEKACPDPVCEVDGDSYDVGDSVPSGDSCNTCSCTDSGVVCTLASCAGSCEQDGQTYELGAEVPADDDCNTCECTDSGVVCTEEECQSPGCTHEGQRYEHGAEIPTDLSCEHCSCRSGEIECAVAPDCGVCPEDEPSCHSRCEFRGVSYANGAEVPSDDECNTCVCEDGNVACTTRECEPTGCSVGGETYPHGSTVPDPQSCNSCTCENGQLTGCTEINCVNPLRRCNGETSKVSAPFEVQDVEIMGDRLLVHVRYPGGCAVHAFDACWGPGVLKTNPPKTAVTLTHDANGENCEGIVEQQLEFSLSQLDELQYSEIWLTLGEHSVVWEN